MTTFRARSVFCGEVAPGVIGVLMAEGESGEGARVELERSITFDDQDRALGQDTHCLGLHTGASVYGGVTGWALTPGRLTLELSKEAIEALDVGAELTMDFDAQLVDDLEEWLAKVLDTAHGDRPPLRRSTPR
jgi:hypothetical protein